MTIDMEAVMEIEHEFGKTSKRPVDENAPKRPLTAYFLWADTKRADLIRENSGFSAPEIGRLMGKMWKETPPASKKVFETKAEKDMKAFCVKFDKYKKTSNYEKFQMKMLAWRIHETKKPYPKDSNAPKRNMSAYMHYGISVRAKIIKENPDIANLDIMKEQSIWWKALSEKERKPWLEMAEEDKAKYLKKFARYSKTDDYIKWASGRDEYKKNMKLKRNRLMGIKKRPRSVSTKARSAKKKKRSNRRSRSRTSRKRSTSRRRRKVSKRRSRAPKAPKRSSSRSASERSSSRSRTPKSSTSRSRSPSRRRSAKHKNSKKSRSRRRSKGRRVSRRKAKGRKERR